MLLSSDSLADLEHVKALQSCGWAVVKSPLFEGVWAPHLWGFAGHLVRNPHRGEVAPVGAFLRNFTRTGGGLDLAMEDEHSTCSG